MADEWQFHHYVDGWEPDQASSLLYLNEAEIAPPIGLGPLWRLGASYLRVSLSTSDFFNSGGAYYAKRTIDWVKDEGTENEHSGTHITTKEVSYVEGASSFEVVNSYTGGSIPSGANRTTTYSESLTSATAGYFSQVGATNLPISYTGTTASLPTGARKYTGGSENQLWYSPRLAIPAGIADNYLTTDIYLEWDEVSYDSGELLSVDYSSKQVEGNDYYSNYGLRGDVEIDDLPWDTIPRIDGSHYGIQPSNTDVRGVSSWSGIDVYMDDDSTEAQTRFGLQVEPSPDPRDVRVDYSFLDGGTVDGHIIVNIPELSRIVDITDQLTDAVDDDWSGDDDPPRYFDISCDEVATFVFKSVVYEVHGYQPRGAIYSVKQQSRGSTLLGTWTVEDHPRLGQIKEVYTPGPALTHYREKASVVGSDSYYTYLQVPTIYHVTAATGKTRGPINLQISRSSDAPVDEDE